MNFELSKEIKELQQRARQFVEKYFWKWVTSDMFSLSENS